MTYKTSSNNRCACHGQSSISWIQHVLAFIDGKIRVADKYAHICARWVSSLKWLLLSEELWVHYPICTRTQTPVVKLERIFGTRTHSPWLQGHAPPLSWHHTPGRRRAELGSDGQAAPHEHRKESIAASFLRYHHRRPDLSEGLPPLPCCYREPASVIDHSKTT